VRFCSRACYEAGRSRPLEDRFWEKVDRSGGPDACHLWIGGSVRNGYGVIGLGGKNDGMEYAHRLVWEWANGPIPEGFEVCHNCPGGDNRLCANLRHLFLGTHTDNMHDASVKGRTASGEFHGRSRLKADDVRAIRATYEAGGVTMIDLAARFGITSGHVCEIVNRTKWAHLI
jgi:hypothetical protein